MVPSSKLLSSNSIAFLKGKRNLLAFSAGVDSSALFFLLIKHQITFDIAIVDYGMREQSKDEVAYAEVLAQKYGKSCFIKEVKIDESNFEARAREARYRFFEEIIAKHRYDTLITAHQLNDRLEWFLMQLSKGAGLVELLGFDEIEERGSYRLVRPLLFTSKDNLIEYLHTNAINYFIDKSNSDPKYRRNYFRVKFADPFIKEFGEGVKRSFAYLATDKKRLFSPRLLQRIENLLIYQRGADEIEDMRIIDIGLKSLGYVASSAQKGEIVRQGEGVIGGTFAVVLKGDKIYLSPYSKVVMPKAFKERCRERNIPRLIRPYLFESSIDLSIFDAL